MSRYRSQISGEGPFHPNQVRDGDPYELSNGHPVYCVPPDGDKAAAIKQGAMVLASDPDVEESGIDAGYVFGRKTLRAPDVSVGNVPDKPGWISGVPGLAVEYASIGEDEEELQEKIAEMLAADTRFIWVVRLLGPRRVEVYEPGVAMRIVTPGQTLTAPGVLRNPVLVDALYDREASLDATLQNLLNRKGFASLEAAQEQAEKRGEKRGVKSGALKALRSALERIALRRGVSLDDSARARIAACKDEARLTRYMDELLVAEGAWHPAD